MRKLFWAVCLLLAARCLWAQPTNPTPNPRLLNAYWDARWIVHPTASVQAFGVYHFRKTFDLSAKPEQFVVNVSADNRYRLFVNGFPVAEGPARSDLGYWHFETLDIASQLRQGKNVIAAVVWNYAEHKPFAQMSFQTGFVMQGNSDAEKVVNTGNNSGWKVTQNLAYQPLPVDRAALRTYLVTGDGDVVEGSRYPWGWEDRDYNDGWWLDAAATWFVAKPRGLGTDGNWMLTPSPIPQMQRGVKNLDKVVRAEGVTVRAEQFLVGKGKIEVPARTKATVLFDNGELTNAHPLLYTSGGNGSQITLTYAEGLFDANRQKGNRNETAGKVILGIQDRFLSDGGERREFRPLHFRTYRYLQMEVETGANPLVIDRLYGETVSYPFEEKAVFEANNSGLDKIWEVGWRTARLCAFETYMDCPYYEQLQYVGDTRIQALISLYVSGDDRLMRKAISDFDHSRFNEGLTQSRYPSADFQVIPTYSLFWVSMIHDYWMHRNDDAFVKSFEVGIAEVLAWYESRLMANGLLGPLTWWNFVDWSWSWSEAERVGGVPPGTAKGGSSIQALQFAYTLNQAADLFTLYGKPAEAKRYKALAKKITAGVYAQCWDAGKRMIADTPEKQIFSQHANILAILTDAVPAAQQADLVQRIAADKSITQATFYFKFYLFQALKKTGQGDLFLPLLQPWHDMIGIGLTTFAENPEPTRSDCHAWSAAPNYEFLSTVCGINPSAPHFATVRIAPFLGELTKVEGKMPHPKGEIAVAFERVGEGLTANISLPAGVTGELVWKGKKVKLNGGAQTLKM